MKRIFLTILALCLITSSASAWWLGPIGPSMRRAGGTFTGGTLTSNLTMSDGTIIELATGTSTSLALRFRTDTDTGLYSDGDGKVRIRSNGANVANIDPAAGGYFNVQYILRANSTLYCDGNVGSPLYYWSIYNGAASSTRATYAIGGGSKNGMGYASTGQPNILASGTEAMRFTATGNRLGPVLASATIDGIATPLEGAVVWNDDANKYQVYNGTIWADF